VHPFADGRGLNIAPASPVFMQSSVKFSWLSLELVAEKPLSTGFSKALPGLREQK
jgi:hypothetical protein